MTVDLDGTIIPDELADFVGKKYKGKFVEENYHGSWGMACRFFNSQPSTKAKEMVRSNIYRSEDEEGNNEKPYCWQQFGSGNFFGQTITHWLPIPPLIKK